MALQTSECNPSVGMQYPKSTETPEQLQHCGPPSQGVPYKNSFGYKHTLGDGNPASVLSDETEKKLLQIAVRQW
ncbi:hypothetical protein P7K49_029497 [Saguinus oedipus]|uniref:Uncharacterized protein n=1 Tax=Saguinus oedipus TaxID=9490 RepID=A0ABQ9U7D6_SAGOE|nr:hypothetical protein P7K49_029497 [Saguinus oedipus]